MSGTGVCEACVCVLCSYPRLRRDTCRPRWSHFSIHALRRCSLLIFLFHATLSKKVTVNRFPRFSQWAIACFLFPLIFQRRGIKCVTRRLAQSNACLLHALLTWRGKSHDASAETQTLKAVWTGVCRPIREGLSAAAPAVGGRDCEPRREEMATSCVVDTMG